MSTRRSKRKANSQPAVSYTPASKKARNKPPPTPKKQTKKINYSPTLCPNLQAINLDKPKTLDHTKSINRYGIKNNRHLENKLPQYIRLKTAEEVIEKYPKTQTKENALDLIQSINYESMKTDEADYNVALSDRITKLNSALVKHQKEQKEESVPLNDNSNNNNVSEYSNTDIMNQVGMLYTF